MSEAGENRLIPWSKIMEYARVEGLDTVETELFKRAIKAMNGVLIECSREKLDATHFQQMDD